MAFVIDAFAHRIVGWQISSSPRSELGVRRARAGDPRAAGRPGRAPRPSIRLRRAGTCRAATPNALRLPGSRPLIGSQSESYDSSLAGTIIGVYNAELCYRHGPWPALTDVEFVLLQ